MVSHATRHRRPPGDLARARTGLAKAPAGYSDEQGLNGVGVREPASGAAITPTLQTRQPGLAIVYYYSMISNQGIEGSILSQSEN